MGPIRGISRDGVVGDGVGDVIRDGGTVVNVTKCRVTV